MAVITLDFETYYDNEFSLRHMTYEQYVRDPRFEAIMCSIHIPSEKELYWVKGDEIGKELQRLELHKHVQIAHNNAFDAFILNDHFGISAAGYGCTMQMARVAKNAEGSMSLDNLSKENNLKPKGTFVQNMLGVRARDMSESQWRDYGDYCLTDSENCTSLYKIYRPYFSTQDLNLISETLRWGAECKFVLNEQLLEDYVERLKVRRETRLELLADAYNVDTTRLRSMLRSSKTFAQMLRDQGVEPPTKINDKGNETYAFAKTDLEFKELADRPNQRVVDLYETKVGTQSSIAETRAATFLAIAKRGKMPFPLVPFKAVTGRHGATQKLNCFTSGNELLTPSGWVDVAAYVEGTPLAQVQLSTGEISWDLNPAWLEKDYEGTIYDIQGTAYKACVTADHRIPFYTRGKWHSRTAEELSALVRLDGLPYKGQAVWKKTNELSDDELILLTALQADGYVTTAGAYVFGFRKTRKIEKFRALLMRMNIHHSYHVYKGDTHTFRIPKQHIPIRVQKIGKGFGSWVLTLDARQRAIILDELPFWDGYKNIRSKATEFYTADRQQADWVNTLMHLSDVGGKVYDYSNKRCNKYVVYAKSAKTTTVNSKDIRKSHGVYRVYCPKVSTDAVLVRRDGCISVIHQCQNLPARGDDTYLRQSMGAPKDHAVVTNDLAQVEARRLAALAGELRLVEQFYRGDDVYSLFGTTLFKYEVSKATPRERSISKEIILSSGFSAGWRSFQTRMKGAYGISLSDEEAQYYIRHYREVHTRITNFWEQCTTAIRTMYKGGEYKFGDNDELTAVKGEIIFADGWRLRYDDIKFEGYDQYGREQYSYYSHRHRSRKHLYSGLVANNVTQGTAARILHWHLFELRKRGKIMSGAVHDELISVVHYKEVFDYYEAMTSVMRTTPEWAKNTPLDCEFELGLNYGTLTDIKTFTQQHYDDLRKYHPTDLLDRYAA